MTNDHDCAVVGEMLLRRALHLTATDQNRDAVDTLVRILDTQLLPTDEPEIDETGREAFDMIRDRITQLGDQDLVDWVGDLSLENYRIDSYHPANPTSRHIEDFTLTLEAAQQWVRQQPTHPTTQQPVSYVVVDLRTREDIWQLNPTRSEVQLQDSTPVKTQPQER